MTDRIVHKARAVAAGVDADALLTGGIVSTRRATVERIDELRLGTGAVVREAVAVGSGIHQRRSLTDRVVDSRRTVPESVDLDRPSTQGIIHAEDSVAVGIDCRQSLAGRVVNGRRAFAARINTGDATVQDNSWMAPFFPTFVLPSLSSARANRECYIRAVKKVYPSTMAALASKISERQSEARYLL